MRAGWILGLLSLVATSTAARPQAEYRVAKSLPAGDGSWDLLSVAPDDQRLYVAHGDGVTAFDLKSGKATDRIVTGKRVHAALAIPGTHDVVSTNGETNDALLFDGLTGRVERPCQPVRSPMRLPGTLLPTRCGS